MRVCTFCGHILDETMEVFRSTACPRCDKDLKICKNCTFYSPGAHWDCRESIGEAVWDKERANFCDYFRFRESSNAADSQNKDSARAARDNFRNLFGGED